MKFFVLLFLLIFQREALSQILFLDINNNPLEKKAAIKAAKQAGKKIVVYPEGPEMFSREKAFELLKSTTPESLFISGHDGGGAFSGDRNEAFSRDDINQLIEKNPDIAKNLRVLGLLGCNTANHSQILDWKQTFPNVSFVAGYDGTAPSGTKPAGWHYIEDTILKSEKLLKETDEKKIKNLLENFRNINYLAATLYVNTNQCQDNPEEQFIFRPLRSGKERFKKFDTSECLEKRDIYQNKYATAYSQYKSGEKEIPKNTSVGELRDMYTFLRQNEHCFEDFYENGDFPTGDHLLYLLFYDDVFKSFQAYYKEEMQEFFDDISIFGDEEKYKNVLKENLEIKKENLERLKIYSKDYSKFEADFKKYLAEEEEDYNSKYAPRYLKTYNDLYRRYQSGQSYEGLVNQMEKDPDWHVFLMKKNKIENLKNSLEFKEESEIYMNIQGEKENLLSEVETIDSILKNNDIKNDHDYYVYSKLPAKNLEEFKKLNRKQLNQFISGINGLDLENTSMPYFNDRVKNATESILYRLDEDIVPFNWHDSNLGEPIDPSEYTRTELNREKNNKTNFESRYFSNGWG